MWKHNHQSPSLSKSNPKTMTETGAYLLLPTPFQLVVVFLLLFVTEN